MIQLQEQRLQKQVQAGEERGFSCLYQRHGRDVLGILLRLTHGDRTEAEDLAQETFIAAYQGRAQFSGKVPLRAWLVGIAVRRWRDGRRRPKPKTVSVAVEAVAPGQTEATIAARASLLPALAALPDDQQTAVLLVLGQGLTYREAAEALGEPVGTIKWRVSEASKRLRKRLSEEEDGV